MNDNSAWEIAKMAALVVCKKKGGMQGINIMG
jgi:hypothetical protein